MAENNDKNVRGVLAAGVAAVVLLSLAIAVPMVLSRIAPQSADSIGRGVERAEMEMEIAERSYEAEAEADRPRAERIDGAIGSSRIVTPVGPAESAPEVHLAVSDPNAKIVGVWLRTPAGASSPVSFDQSSDTLTVTFVKTGERRSVPMSQLFTGGSWSLSPGRSSAEARVNCPPGYTGTVEAEFVHVSPAGARVSVKERAEVY